MKLYQDRNWLYKKAIIERLKDYEMADLAKCSESIIEKYRHEFGILRSKPILSHRFIEDQPANLLSYNETKKAAIAGFCDGDGCISITKVKRRRSDNYSYNAGVIFSQSRNDKIKILRSIQYHFGGIITGTKRTRLKAMAAQLRIGFWQSFNLLCECCEYLMVRNKQALNFFELFEEKLHKPLNRGTIEQQEWLERLETIKKKNHWFNRRGTSETRKHTDQNQLYLGLKKS